MDIIYRYDPFQPALRSEPANAEEALAALTLGNARFAGLVAQMQRVTLGEKLDGPLVIPISPLSLGLPLWSGAVHQQAPFALVLGCADARVPIETILDQGFNDLFAVRIAGNVLGTECLGSIDYAVRHFGDSLRVVVVLGHSGCGAVSAAVDTYLSPSDYAEIAATHALRSLVDRIMIAVRGAAKALERVGGREVRKRPGYRELLVETAVYLNAAITAYDLSRELAVLDHRAVSVVYGVYDLSTLRVHSRPDDAGGSPPFGSAAVQPDDFVAIASSIAAAVLAGI